MKYEIRGKEIYSEKGRLVATLDGGGNPVMEAGMAGPHARGVREFLGSFAVSAGTAEAKEEKIMEAAEAVPAEKPTVFVGTIPAAKPLRGEEVHEEREMDADEWAVSTIPDEELPEFKPEFGVYTPEFRDYVKRHKLTEGQKAALVDRLAKKKRS